MCYTAIYNQLLRSDLLIRHGGHFEEPGSEQKSLHEGWLKVQKRCNGFNAAFLLPFIGLVYANFVQKGTIARNTKDFQKVVGEQKNEEIGEQSRGDTPTTNLMFIYMTSKLKNIVWQMDGSIPNLKPSKVTQKKQQLNSYPGPRFSYFDGIQCLALYLAFDHTFHPPPNTWRIASSSNQNANLPQIGDRNCSMM